MRIQLVHTFEDLISVENLLEAWKEFVRGKRKKLGVQSFSLNLMDNILSLHRDLAYGMYRHGDYEAFRISDPKPRDIHKSSVRDRLLHHAIYCILYPFFDRTFISDSFSCRLGKGTHKAITHFQEFGYQVSKNNTRTCWILKCDIKKFFASIDHTILLDIVRNYIPDKRIIALLGNVIQSFSSTGPGVGLPLGNLTSQLFVNVYMNAFDQFMKHKLKAKYYIRYADDFVMFSDNRKQLEEYVPIIRDFLWNRLRLTLHPRKVSIRSLGSGVDFLGWVNFPDHRVLRRGTRRRMLKRLRMHPKPESLNSYLGLLQHGNAKKLREKILL